MEAIILVDHTKTVQEVFTVDSISKDEIKKLIESAKAYGFSVLRRHANEMRSAEDIAVVIASMNDASTNEIPALADLAESAEVPIVSLDEPVIEIGPNLDMDEEEFKRAWGA